MSLLSVVIILLSVGVSGRAARRGLAGLGVVFGAGLLWRLCGIHNDSLRMIALC